MEFQGSRVKGVRGEACQKLSEKMWISREELMKKIESIGKFQWCQGKYRYLLYNQLYLEPKRKSSFHA